MHKYVSTNLNIYKNYLRCFEKIGGIYKKKNNFRRLFSFFFKIFDRFVRVMKGKNVNPNSCQSITHAQMSIQSPMLITNDC